MCCLQHCVIASQTFQVTIRCCETKDAVPAIPNGHSFMCQCRLYSLPVPGCRNTSCGPSWQFFGCRHRVYKVLAGDVLEKTQQRHVVCVAGVGAPAGGGEAAGGVGGPHSRGDLPAKTGAPPLPPPGHRRRHARRALLPARYSPPHAPLKGFSTPPRTPDTTPPTSQVSGIAKCPAGMRITACTLHGLGRLQVTPCVVGICGQLQLHCKLQQL